MAKLAIGRWHSGKTKNDILCFSGKSRDAETSYYFLNILNTHTIYRVFESFEDNAAKE